MTTSLHIIGFFGGWQEFTKFLVMEGFNFGTCLKQTKHSAGYFSNNMEKSHFSQHKIDYIYTHTHIQ